MEPDLDAARLEAFRKKLESSRRKRLDYKAIWEAYALAFPGRPTGAEERLWLKSALQRLASEGHLKLPSLEGKNWDRHLGIALPMFAQLRRELPARTHHWKSFPWHPQLSWVADLPYLPPGHEAFLKRVHEGFVAGVFQQSVPLKYRSLQLTGDEKRLGLLSRSELFATGRLRLADLGCIEDIPPLATEPLSGDPSIIIFENAGAFAVARKVLSQGRSPYGWIGYGGGRSLVSSIRSLLTARKPFERIEYVGDLDREGLHIANAVRNEARRAGLGDVHPAAGLHAAMIASAARFGAPQGWPDRSGSRKNIEQLLEFLPADVRYGVGGILESGRRVPEEVLGPDEFKAAWHIEGS